MNDDDIKTALALCEAAVDAPWQFRDGICDLRSPGGYRVLQISGFEAASDMEFIAAARTGWPLALREVQRLRAALVEACDDLELLNFSRTSMGRRRIADLRAVGEVTP